MGRSDICFCDNLVGNARLRWRSRRRQKRWKKQDSKKVRDGVEAIVNDEAIDLNNSYDGIWKKLLL